MNGDAQAEGTPRAGESFDVDHAYIRQALKWLNGAEDEEALAVLLADFNEYLRRHFAVEERHGGFFSTVVDNSPRHQLAVDTLRQEHRQMLAEMAALRDELEEPCGKASDAVRNRVRALVTQLEGHEQREEALLQDVLARDLGGQA